MAPPSPDPDAIHAPDSRPPPPDPAHYEKTQRESIPETDVYSVEPANAAQLQTHEQAAADKRASRRTAYRRFRPYLLTALALAILGWWVSATVLPATRPRWIVQSIWAWFFIAVIAFRFIPNAIVTRPVHALWSPFIATPFLSLPYSLRLALAWLVLLAVVFASAFGLHPPSGTSLGDRAISVLGLFVFQFAIWLSSKNRSRIEWRTIIVGLLVQQLLALFVLKSRVGLDIFSWLATLAADFLHQAELAAMFLFDKPTIEKHWFFINVLSAIIFFIAFIQALFYLGVMQWVIGKFAWFFFKTMNISGAEAVVAAGSPFIGQGESACLVRPYVDVMTPSEIHLMMTSGFSTIAGSVLIAYINLGVEPTTLITASVMSIPSSIAISKLRMPELEEPVTRGSVVVDRGELDENHKPANVLHAFSRGATFGLIVAGQILANVLTVLALIYVANGLLTWVGRGFGIAELKLELILSYLFYPLTFLMGVPRHEILRVSALMGTKFVANEFVAYTQLAGIMASSEPLSPRAKTIASFALCGFANLASLGIQIGVLTALAPSRGKVISSLAFSAMLCGFLSTMQSAAIAGMLV